MLQLVLDRLRARQNARAKPHLLSKLRQLTGMNGNLFSVSFDLLRLSATAKFIVDDFAVAGDALHIDFQLLLIDQQLLPAGNMLSAKQPSLFDDS